MPLARLPDNEPRPEAAVAKAAEISHQLGLALSGGGFRASAFHLGVLKRLAEIGLLERVRVLSTVSGGSIVGAYWVGWQTTRSNTLGPVNRANWNEFERSMITAMRRGVRWQIVWQGLAGPAVLIGAIASGMAALIGVVWAPLPAWSWASLAVTVLIAAVIIWHYSSSDLLEAQYAARLFGHTLMSDLTESEERPHPKLCVNATGLNAGEHLIFCSDPPGARIPPWLARVISPLLTSR